MNLKRFFALMLALALSLTMLQGVAFGADVDDIIDVTGATIDGTSIIMKAKVTSINPLEVQVGSGDPNDHAISASAAGALVIPATVTHNNIEYTVTEIGSCAFIGCSKLTSVTLPAGIEEIGQGAFASCTSLASLTLPAGLIGIGEWAFADCTSLTSVTFNGSVVTVIINDAFNGASQLRTINLAGDYNEDMLKALAATLQAAANWDPALPLNNLTLNYNQSWADDEVEALKKALLDAGIAEADMPTLNPYTPPTTPTGGSAGSAGAGAWYIGTLNGADGQPTYTQIVDTPDTTQMLQSGSTITVTGQSPTGIIVKLDPTALSGKQSLSINSSIADMQLTAEQIASLIQQADGNTIHITIKQTANGNIISILAGGRTITL